MAGLPHDTTCGVRTSPSGTRRGFGTFTSPRPRQSSEESFLVHPGPLLQTSSKVLRFGTRMSIFPTPHNPAGRSPTGRPAEPFCPHLIAGRAAGTGGAPVRGTPRSISAPRRARMVKGCDQLGDPGGPALSTADLSPLADGHKDGEGRLTVLAAKIVGWHRQTPLPHRTGTQLLAPWISPPSHI